MAKQADGLELRSRPGWRCPPSRGRLSLSLVGHHHQRRRDLPPLLPHPAGAIGRPISLALLIIPPSLCPARVPGRAGTGGGGMAGWLESTTGIPSRGRSTGRNACVWMARSKSTCAVSALAQQPPTSGTLPGFGTPRRFVRKSPGSRRRLSSEHSAFPLELESVLRN